ncbi:hypothetical protein [Ahrensia sp. 13_GOM-1096m]|uniref:hypothetical protein n=1 Tax=Ahrensia sp. 13_GOM-1096m TaxID=1380380 RepID=UPI00047DE167|nr:hypothetical protein [Ahrensia sp. 13_GOM-1096m]
MKLAIFIIAVIPLVVIGAAGLRPELVLGGANLTAAMVWSISGTLFSYLGFCFSVYAVLEVRNLSNRYFAKQRLPDIKKQLDKITHKMAQPNQLKILDIRAERFFSEMAVVMRQLGKIKVTEFTTVLKRAEEHHQAIEAMLISANSSNDLVNDSHSYWELFRALTELSDEIEAYNKGVQASL